MIFLLSGCKARYEPAPQITEGKFPFVLEYEKNGERYLIEDTVVCTFDGYDMSNNFAIFGFPYLRSWDASLESGDESKTSLIEFEPNTESMLAKGRINTESRVILYYGHGGYYLGDSNYKEKYPYINYSETYKTSDNTSEVEFTELSFDELEKYFGIKIIKFEFSEPIKNKFK